MSRDCIPYGRWWIKFDPPPIPVRSCDWQFWHDDYDGAPDAGDARRGTAGSLAEACELIDEWEDENFDCSCSAPVPGDCMALKCRHRDDVRSRAAARQN